MQVRQGYLQSQFNIDDLKIVENVYSININDYKANYINFNSFNSDYINNFIIGHLNIRSLDKNSDMLTVLLEEINHKIDILCLTEVWSNHTNFRFSNICRVRG